MERIGSIPERKHRSMLLADAIDVQVLETDGSIIFQQDDQEVNILYTDLLSAVAMYQKWRGGQADEQ